MPERKISMTLSRHTTPGEKEANRSTISSGNTTEPQSKRPPIDGESLMNQTIMT